jgi:hypothetical protein
MWFLFVLVLIGISLCSMIMQAQPIGRSSAHSSAYNETETNIDKSLLYLFLTTTEKPVFRYLEYIVTVLLGLEIFVRFIISKTKRQFFKNVLNVIDLVNIIIPVSIYIVMKLAPKYREEGVTIDPNADLLKYLPKGFQAMYLLTCLAILRIFRVWRVMQHIKMMRIMVMTIRYSWREFCLIFAVLGIAALIFGCLIFFAELMENNMVHFGHTLWWALITMTTVGYGDFYPVSTAGYIVGALCIVCGILILVMPIPIIVSNFGKFYNYWDMCDQLQMRMKEN